MLYIYKPKLLYLILKHNCLGGPPSPLYCDMDTEDGGWTLVWSYGFNDYNNFWDGSNYVEPIPSAGWTTGNV